MYLTQNSLVEWRVGWCTHKPHPRRLSFVMTESPHLVVSEWSQQPASVNRPRAFWSHFVFAKLHFFCDIFGCFLMLLIIETIMLNWSVAIIHKTHYFGNENSKSSLCMIGHGNQAISNERPDLSMICDSPCPMSVILHGPPAECKKLLHASLYYTQGLYNEHPWRLAS